MELSRRFATIGLLSSCVIAAPLSGSSSPLSVTFNQPNLTRWLGNKIKTFNRPCSIFDAVRVRTPSGELGYVSRFVGWEDLHLKINGPMSVYDCAAFYGRTVNPICVEIIDRSRRIHGLFEKWVYTVDTVFVQEIGAEHVDVGFKVLNGVQSFI